MQNSTLLKVQAKTLKQMRKELFGSTDNMSLATKRARSAIYQAEMNAERGTIKINTLREFVQQLFGDDATVHLMVDTGESVIRLFDKEIDG